jgi:hypothetical protein
LYDLRRKITSCFKEDSSKKPSKCNPNFRLGVCYKRISGRDIWTRYLDEISGRAIATAKEDREDADYGIGINITKEEAERVLNDAEEFITKVVDAQQILKKELRKQKKI